MFKLFSTRGNDSKATFCKELWHRFWNVLVLTYCWDSGHYLLLPSSSNKPTEVLNRVRIYRCFLDNLLCNFIYKVSCEFRLRRSFCCLFSRWVENTVPLFVLHNSIDKWNYIYPAKKRKKISAKKELPWKRVGQWS